jgi:hypothetical protein
LPASDAAVHVNRTVDFIVKTYDATKEKDIANYARPEQALGALCGQLDAARASRVAGTIIATLGEVRMSGEVKVEYISLGYIASVLTKVAERLDAPGSLQAAENLVLVLRKAEKIALSREELRAALLAVCKPLDAAGAGRVAEAIATATREPKTSVLVRALFADAHAALASRLTADQAASLERALADALLADLADAKSREFRGLLGQALATACGHPSATSAARAARGLAAAIRDPQTPLTTLKPLAAALALVSGQLPPREASSQANQTVEVLDSLWVAQTAPLDRASVAEALAAVWTRLDPTDAASRAKRAAANLEHALRDVKDAPNELYRLAEALTAVYNHLGPAERSERASAVADALVTALRIPRDDPWKIVHLSAALAGLFAHLDRSSAVRVADAVFTVLGGPNVPQFRFENHEKLFKEVAARLDESDLRRLLDHPLAVGGVQRILLNSLARSKNRSFRNTWDYLDGTAPNGNGTDPWKSSSR